MSSDALRARIIERIRSHKKPLIYGCFIAHQRPEIEYHERRGHMYFKTMGRSDRESIIDWIERVRNAGYKPMLRNFKSDLGGEI